jgi:hypothetical protein
LAAAALARHAHCRKACSPWPSCSGCRSCASALQTQCRIPYGRARHSSLRNISRTSICFVYLLPTGGGGGVRPPGHTVFGVRERNDQEVQLQAREAAGTTRRGERERTGTQPPSPDRNSASQPRAERHAALVLQLRLMNCRVAKQEEAAQPPIGSQRPPRTRGAARGERARARARAHPRGSREASKCLGSSNVLIWGII